jgi:hypothetical protein
MENTPKIFVVNYVTIILAKIVNIVKVFWRLFCSNVI